MPHETTSSSSSRSLRRLALPPSLHLTTQENDHECSDRSKGSKPTIKNFGRVLHHVVFPGRFGAVTPLERVAEVTLEGEKEVSNASVPRTLKRKTAGRSGSRRSESTSPFISQRAPSHISAPHRPRTLITSYPPLNVSDIPPRSPTNKSPFSAILLAEEDEEREEEEPALALWHMEQLHQARIAKLTRHLGEEIPAELVLGPAFLSHGGSLSFVHSRRGGCHHRRRSLDPSTFTQEISITQSAGVLRRSKSLREQGGTHPLSSAADIIPNIACAEDGGVSSAKTMINASLTGPSPSAALRPRQVNSDICINIERVSMDPYPESHPSQHSRPSVEISREPPLSLSRSRTLPRRPASRRVEKLADFFGVNHKDVSAVAQAHRSARDLSISPTSAAGDLAAGFHAPPSQVEVEVKVSKPTRFWNGRTTTKNVHPGDVLDKLRMMKAS